MQRLEFAREVMFCDNQWLQVTFSAEKKWHLDIPDGCKYKCRDLRYLTSNSLTYLKDQNFGNLTSLLTLDLQDNQIYTVEVKAFVLLEKLNSLNLKENALRHIQPECFSTLTSLQYIYFSNFYFCSYARHVRVCEPNSDGISSFSHLLDSIVLRISVWIVAGLACIGNASVVISRSLLTDTNRIHSFYIKNLSIADFLMCLYLFIIAGHDVAFRGEYIRHDVSWRHSWQCTFAGMLSTLSSEASIFIMTIITADRYLSIVYPLVLRRRTMVFAGTLVAASWVAAATIAIVPVFNLGYFGDEYYGNNGVCLPLQIHDPFSKGWQYSMVVFCGLNSVAFGFICYAYITMFITISRSKLGLRSSQQQQDRTIAKRFSFIVATDLLCWLPIIVIKTLAISATSVTEHPLPPAMREIKSNQTSTFLPASSSLHPFLWRWKVSFHQFNIQLRLLFSPSSPNELKTALVVLLGLSSKIHRVSPSNRVPSVNSNSKSNFLKQCAAHLSVLVGGRGGLVVRSRLWGRRVPGSRPDSTEDPPCMGPVAR
ncbi:Relaxin receptor 1 [Araneus ventricosus]|uniref:Relaxin receptor 1 n=1 Tax=Araneus ventricosus TaxID=182803 RepID=A0A4Y2NQM7_ARAVE|nr:Relaxin receptor 1 [Araneus ventricosus]